ncbi:MULTISPECIES: hypothetical protein [Photorhabdus]|uniref:hypothetical protein n=1 Tax=Photorhabdus TaxID=29487 RepID=UPI000A94D095|nr:hypothetical protein [Photorhabdus thracensis]MCC8423022.1 hypothetical protein [Photorhabdus thracensis]
MQKDEQENKNQLVESKSATIKTHRGAGTGSQQTPDRFKRAHHTSKSVSQKKGEHRFVG